MEVLIQSEPVPFRSILLAAGRGERLRPLTDRIGKPGIPVGDRPLGAFGLAALATHRPTLVNLAHRVPETRAALEPWAEGEVEFVVEAPEALGTAGTVAAALGRLEETFITYNSDVIADLDVGSLVATHERLGAPGTVAVVEVEVGADFGENPAGSEAGVIERFVDRRAEAEAPGLRFMGIAVFERRAVAGLVTPGEIAGLGERVLKPLAERGTLAFHLHRGFFLDVGTPDSLATARRYTQDLTDV